MTQYGVIEWAFQAAFKKTVQVGKLQYMFAVTALCIQMLYEFYARLRQGASFICTEHVHGTQILDGGKTFDDHTLICKTQSAACQCH